MPSGVTTLVALAADLLGKLYTGASFPWGPTDVGFLILRGLRDICKTYSGSLEKSTVLLFFIKMNTGFGRVAGMNKYW